MDAHALRRLDLCAQRDALRAGVVDARALTEAHLDAIAVYDRALNSYLHVDAAGARAQAAESARRLAQGAARALEGVPVAVKDNLDVAGLPTTAGMATRRGRIAARDAGAVARLRAAGCVILGKLNMHEAALGADNDNPHFGACHNPHRIGHTPGGSSGGSAAAVAAGLAAASLGSDSMGSVRIPASYCGVFGLKPSRGLVSTAGSVKVSSRLDHVGPLARSARDLGALLAVLAGYDPGCPASRPLALAPAVPGPLRIGVLRLPMLPLEADIAADFERGLALLAALGHALEPIDCGAFEPGPARRAGLLVCELEMLAEHAEDWTHSRDLFSPALAAMLAFAERQGASALGRALARIDQARVNLQRWLAPFDLLVAPTTPQRAFAFGSAVPANQADFTCLASFAGLPALSLPLPVAAGALPLGMQLVGPHGADLRLLALAEALAAQAGLEIQPVEATDVRT